MNERDEGSHDEPLWKQLYQTALFELNPNLLLQKIADAQKAIFERSLALGEDETDRLEKEFMANAHTVLNDLGRIYAAGPTRLGVCEPRVGTTLDPR
jgi:hypothetical protein